jgi:hypothetical protein
MLAGSMNRTALLLLTGPMVLIFEDGKVGALGFVHSLICPPKPKPYLKLLVTWSPNYNNNTVMAGNLEYPCNDKYRKGYLDALEPLKKGRFLVCVETAKYD